MEKLINFFINYLAYKKEQMAGTINEINAHPRDLLIEFDPIPHKYTCKGDANYMSVTTWLHSHFKPFDADAVIAKMKLTNPKCKYYGQTPAEIKAGWDKNRDEAAAAGTAMHAAIEEYSIRPGPPHLAETSSQGNAEVLPETSSQDNAEALAEMGGVVGVPPSHFHSFILAHPHLKPYRAEWMIFDEDVKLAGSIDMVYENPDGTLMIYDWKRCKEIKKNNSFGEFALTECINHLPDTNYWHYALQLNTYKAILEAKYEKKVTQMCLVCLHPNLPSYQIWKVPVLANEMKELFALRL
jgi:hypothetical protein